MESVYQTPHVRELVQAKEAYCALQGAIAQSKPSIIATFPADSICGMFLSPVSSSHSSSMARFIFTFAWKGDSSVLDEFLHTPPIAVNQLVRFLHLSLF